MGVEFTYFQPVNGVQDSFIYLLTAVLFLITIICFIKSKFDVLNPSFIYSICITGCCSLAALYTEEWNLPMHFNTAMIIIVMSVMFLLGGMIAELCNYNDSKQLIADAFIFNGFFINWKIFLLLTGILVFFLFFNYNEFLNAATQVTQETKIGKMLRSVIEARAHQQIKFSRWYAYRMTFAKGLAYISIVAVWINLMAKQYKEILKWGVFLVLYVPFIILTGGRQGFMYLVMFSMISFFLIYRKKLGDKISLTKEITIIGLAMVFFLLSFLGIGLVNGKIGTDTKFLSVLVHYAGTNISAFDVYINEMFIPDTQYIGTTTLQQIYRVLYVIGFDVPQFFQYITLFTCFAPVSTNVYTAFYRYINDFGYLGCALIMFLIGFFYTFLYRKMYHCGLKNQMILLYASIAYPMFLIGREERFLNEIMTSSTVYLSIELLVLYKFFSYFNERRN